MQMRVSQYEKLREFVRHYNNGGLDILIIEGSAGAGKSSIVRQVVTKGGTLPEEEYCWLEGRTSAAALYKRLYENRDKPVIIDDVDGLYKDKECVNLLKCLCQTWAEKTVQWNTVTKSAANVPTSFKTKSKVIVITNSWKGLNKHIGAVQDRGLLITFHPDAETIHQYVKDELSNNPDVYDQEVYDFIGAHLGIISEPSIRPYRGALSLKRQGADWQEVLIESFGLDDNSMTALNLCRDKSLSHNQRAEMFAKILKRSERTYWRAKKDLADRGINLD